MFRDKLKELIGKKEEQQEGNDKKKIENLVFLIILSRKQVRNRNKTVKNLLKQIAFWTRLLQNEKDYLNHNLVVYRKYKF